jgi:hypothetical protein
MRPVGQFPQCIQSTLLCVASFYAVDTPTEMVDMFTKAQNLQSAPKESGKNHRNRHAVALQECKKRIPRLLLSYELAPPHTVKKRLAIFPTPGGMSLTKLSMAWKNFIIPGQVEFGK